MNAQSKTLTRIAAALVLAMACGNTWAVGNSITFEGAEKSGNTGNGINNTGNIDANGGTEVNVRIRQINEGSGTAHSSAASAGNMNQVGEYYGAPVTIGGTATVRIGQGVKFESGATTFDATTENASKNNLVKGSITGTSQAYISQTGATSTVGRLANVKMSAGVLKANQIDDNQELKVGSTTTMSGGNLTVNQNAVNQKVDVAAMSGGTLNVTQDATGQRANVTTMSGGTLNVNQKATATDGTVNITQFTGGKTDINQGAASGSGGVKSTLTLDSGASGVADNYGKNVGEVVTINQTGSYQNATVKYENTGYNGTLNLEAHGDAGGGTPVYATVDVKM